MDKRYKYYIGFINGADFCKAEQIIKNRHPKRPITAYAMKDKSYRLLINLSDDEAEKLFNTLGAIMPNCRHKLHKANTPSQLVCEAFENWVEMTKNKME